MSDSLPKVTHPNVRDSRPRWRPTALVQASAAVHVAAAGSVLLAPALWPWAVGGVVADHLLLTAAGLWPRSTLLGPNWVRLPDAAVQRRQVALTIDDGPDPQITPPVLDLLDQYQVRATFFCIGERVAAYPDLAREIVRRGHAVENHSQQHLHRFSLLGPRAMAAEVAAAQDTIGAITGHAPRFFRAPAGLRNPFLDPVLSRLSLQLASWTRRGFDTVAQSPATVVRRLLRGLAAGDILLLHDGHAARTAAGAAVIIEALPPVLSALRDAALEPITLAMAL